jgi:hypothetical protein
LALAAGLDDAVCVLARAAIDDATFEARAMAT